MFADPIAVTPEFMKSLTDDQVQALYEIRVAKWMCRLGVRHIDSYLRSGGTRRADFFKDIRAGRLLFLFGDEMGDLFPAPLAA